MQIINTRRPPLEDAQLPLYETEQVSPIWEAYQPAMEAMFDKREKDAEIGIAESNICIYKYGEPAIDWSWYVNQRYDANRFSRVHEKEEQLYKIIFLNDGDPTIHIHGHMGVGKSTILYYFFKHYIPYVKKWDANELEHLIPVMVSMKYANVEVLEKNWNKRVTDFLYDRFPEMTNKAFLFEVARSIYPKRLKGENGDLLETVDEKDRDFVKDTEFRIKAALERIDRATVPYRINELFERNGDTGQFNCKAIILLAMKYNYRFIFIVDNLDPLPDEMQQEISRLVKDKIRSYQETKNIKFIITARESFFDTTRRETYSISFGEQTQMLNIPSLSFASVLKQRKTAFFDPKREVGKELVINVENGISVKLANPERFIEKVFERFDNVNNLTNLHMLANKNIRAMLSLVGMVLKSPHLTREEIGIIVEQATQKNERMTMEERNISETDLDRYVHKYRMIDALLRSTNHLVAKVEDPYLRTPNVYLSSTMDHFTSTLTRLFVIAIINARKEILYNDLLNQLSDLGHEPSLIKKAVEDLMEFSVLFTNRGLRVEDNEEKRAGQKLEKRDLPYSDFLLEEIAPSLRYMQAMAFVTPMEDKYVKMVEVPKTISTGIKGFNIRLKAAAALYQQVRDDMASQIDYVNSHRDKARLTRIMERYSFQRIIDGIRENVRFDFEDIKKHSPTLVAGIDFEDLFPPLRGAVKGCGG